MLDVDAKVADGALDLAGVPKLAWTRVSGEVQAAATRITLQGRPGGLAARG